MASLAEWSPLRGRLRAGGWVVDIWHEPVHPGAVSFDDYLVTTLPGGRLRLAAIDAAVNEAAGLRGRLWGHQATGEVRAQLRHVPTLTGALARAHHNLFDASRPPMFNPMAACMAVDLDLEQPSGDFAQAGDCEVWVRDAAGWHNRTTPALASEASRAWRAWLAANPGVSPARRWRAQAHLLGDPAAWTCPAVGAFDQITPQVGVFADVEEVVVTSDGARLTRRALERGLRPHLEDSLQRTPPDHPHPWPHGDLAVLHARYQPQDDPQH
ncbi:hypothetical protein D5H75_37930 [Bailinhaonella thermotolerans]|uniref:Uncharacterized protein n=2 Tax=Bailinhaonella thermotolerans TaxID=1070861 RepID=A0A3A4A858_9ACTN|nr:hypothetical protein D5H75_37930 [Bailinhaonella thermotolerans]